VTEDDTAELNTALLTELAHLDLAYAHLAATTEEEVLLSLRKTWPGTLIVSPTMPGGPKQAGPAEADHWLGLGADLIAFGRGFLANPDLVERLHSGLPVAPVEENTFYQGGDAGYITYPTYQHTA
jgi:N-ethylmaleimide reductase